MAKKKKKHDEHMDESWLIPYADILTLLLALFIVLFASSSIDEGKFTELKESFNSVLNGSSGLIEELNSGRAEREFREPVSESEIKNMEAIQEQNDLRKVKEIIDQMITDKGLVDSVRTELNADALKIVLTNEILFESGEASLRESSLTILRVIANVLENVPNSVQVSGHTDDVPIQTAQFPSNWELSTARSISVLKYIIETNGDLDASRFSSAGYGEYKPLVPNDSFVNKAKNRRVELEVKRENGEGLMVVE